MTITRPLTASLIVLASTLLCAEEIPLSNWTVPPYRSVAGSLSPMTDVSPAVAFTAVQPCRLVDTRAGSGFPSGYGPPSLSPGAARNFDLNSQPDCADIPPAVVAYSVNVTVVGPTGPGHLVIFPQGEPQPTVSSLNYVTGQTVGNAVIAAAGTGGGVTIVAGVSGTDVIVDINGYFTAEQNPQQFFEVSGFLIGGAMIRGVNSAFINPAHGIEGITASPDGVGVLGRNDAPAPFGPPAGAAVRGIAQNVAGIHGISTNFAGVYGQAPLTGVLGSSYNGGVGVAGSAAGGVGTGIGVSGLGGETGIGVGGSSLTGYGTFGTSHGTGAAGELTNFSNEVLVTGYLGTNFGSDPGSGDAPWAVFAQGDIGASGTKHFIDPHPSDPSKAISYVSLEGPEAGTYFRGRGRFENGIARIPVPEHFRLVTDPEGLSVQVTPIGAMATFAVLSVGLEEIVVQSSRNVEFFYLVQGVRATFKDLDAMTTSAPFLPRSADARLPAYLSGEQKRRLVANGTYNRDGSANVETARRLGWDREWKKRSPPAAEADRD